MSYKKGDILLVDFPFSDLFNSKRRPVLVIKDESEYGDLVCFQITSKHNHKNILKITKEDLNEPLKLDSFVKYDKCFTIDKNVINKKLTSVKMEFLEKLKSIFCEEVF